ncbi:Ku protein [Streptomyces pactum]|uniref:Non-homologous end joining protein Ku n=1 Tax=Streptomyces pactum TaxID=68249 RepID=A0ABS0NEK5_9ACTN|nr:Ku protein [Streptomyces pactum]MBH5333635.1 Ku protein [Streptomyces pactum]
MRPVWSGAVSFGLVTIPIKVFPATEDHAISFRQYHTADQGRIRYRKVCELEDKELAPEEIGRAYDAGGGTLVPVSDQDLDRLPLPTAKAIEVSAFVDADRIDPLRFGRPYFLQAAGDLAAKPYVLLREALKRTDRIALTKYAWHNRERLGALRVVGDTIVLQAMHWPDEIRSAEGLAPGERVDVSDAEVDEALALMEAIGGTDLSAYRDRYREALEAVIQAKAEGKEPPVAEAEEAPAGQVVDLMAALRNSVRAAQERRGEPGEADVHELADRPAKKTGSRKAGGSGKPAAKKAPRKRAAS